MIIRGEHRDTGADLVGPANELCEDSFVEILARQRRKEPNCLLEQIRIGIVHARVFLPCHGMSAEKSLDRVFSKHFQCLIHHRCFRAPDIGQQCGGWTLNWQGGARHNADFPNAQSIYAGIAAALAANHAPTTQAVVDAFAGELTPEALNAVKIAAALMAMNNVYYRFRHLVGKPEYAQLPARLRMQRIAKPATNKLDFELFCLAVSAINNCETCIRSH